MRSYYKHPPPWLQKNRRRIGREKFKETRVQNVFTSKSQLHANFNFRRARIYLLAL